MCLVDKTEFELGTNTAQHYLRKYCTSEGYNKITPNKFLIVPMQKKTRSDKTIFFANVVNIIPKKRYALYMRFLCVSFFPKKNTWLVNIFTLLGKK